MIVFPKFIFTVDDLGRCEAEGLKLFLWQAIADPSALVVSIGKSLKVAEAQANRLVIGSDLSDPDSWRLERIEDPKLVALLDRLLGDERARFQRLSKSIDQLPGVDEQRYRVLNLLSLSIYGLGKPLSQNQLERLEKCCDEILSILNEEGEALYWGKTSEFYFAKKSDLL